MKHKLDQFINVEHVKSSLEFQIIKWIINASAKGLVLGLSGGVDSTTVACIANTAINEFNKTTNNDFKLLGLILPSNVNVQADKDDGIKVAKQLGIEYQIINIQPIVNSFQSSIPNLTNSFDVGNLYSETRAVILSRIAALNNYLIAGTGNRDEDLNIGYFTRRGDGAVDNNILGNIPKRLVRQLAKSYGMNEKIYNRVATAGLWEEQTDEKELGYSYDQVEIVMHYYLYNNVKDPLQIKSLTSFDLSIIKDIINRHKNTAYKREMPPMGEINYETC